MPAVDAWLENGPADGKILAVETQPDGSPPDLATVTATDAHVVGANEPAADITYI